MKQIVQPESTSDKKNERNYLEVLRKIGAQGVIGPTPGERLSRLVQMVAKDLCWDVCSLYIIEEKTNELILAATHGLKEESVGRVRLPISEGLVGNAVQKDKPIFLEYASKDPRFKYFPETEEDKYISMAAVPFSRDGKVTGVMAVQTIEPYKFTTADMHFLDILVRQIGQAVNVALSLKTLNQRAEAVFIGIPASPGIVEAMAHVIAPSPDRVQVLARRFKGTDFEKELFTNALQDSLNEIEKLTEQIGDHGSPAAQIFSAQRMILSDNEFSRKVFQRIEEQEESAPRAVGSIMDEYIEKFSHFKHRIMREKSQDLKDIRDSILLHMGERVTAFTPDFIEEKTIIVAKELTPQETVHLDLSKVVGIVTEKGNKYSHAAILARSLDLPAVVGVDHIVDTVKAGDSILVDGSEGYININSVSNGKENKIRKSGEIQDLYSSLRKSVHSSKEVKSSLAEKVSLSANIGLPLEIEYALREKISSVGLLRTEFFYMQQHSWPDLETQVEYYERNLSAFASGKVTIRLLDIGGDKFLKYMPQLKEDNSQLGFRSVRMLLYHTDLLKSQIQAIHLAAKKTKTRPEILIPMVTHVWEIEAVREVMMEVTEGIAYSLGIMIEIPIALFQIKELSEEADFISIGTNDLSQYLLAVDRNNPKVNHLYNPLHPALLRALDYLFQSISGLSKTFSICGEMAGDRLPSLALLALGFRNMSIAPVHLPEILYLTHQIPEEVLTDLSPKLLSGSSPKDSEKLLQSIIREHAPLLS